MPDSNKNVQNFITAVGALAETTAVVFRQLLAVGFNDQQAFALAKDFFNFSLAGAGRSKSDAPAKEEWE